MFPPLALPFGGADESDGSASAWTPSKLIKPIRSHELSHKNGNLLRHRDGHSIADDLDQLSIRVRLANQDSGVTTPAQGKSRSVVKNSVRVPRALDVEVHVTLERRSDFPV